MNLRKRLFSILMAVTMLMTYMPALAFADSASANASSGRSDSNDLLMHYLQEKVSEQTGKNMSSGKRKARRAARGSQLRGNDAKIYEALVPGIKAIAAGEAKTSVVSVPISVIVGDDNFLDLDELNAYAEEGQEIDAVCDPETELVTEAANALYEAARGDWNIDNIQNALLADFPYEFYWYDKTYDDGKTVAIYAIYNDGVLHPDNYERGYGFSEDAAIDFYFIVSSDYSDSGATGTIRINTAKTGAASRFADNAGTIINQNAGLSDLEKLYAYKDAVCEATSYNDEAMENEDTPYGDPWQMIWVFDGDETTNVLCEGYSKAFQFLCDNSSFDNEQIECDTVTGFLDGGTGAGEHMWNILRMDDGRNYMADITNSDADSAGEDGALFLKGYSSYDPETGYVYATPVTDNGKVTYRYDNDAYNTFYEEELELSAYDYGESEEPYTDPSEAEREAQRKAAERAAAAAKAAEAKRNGVYDRKLPKVKQSKPAAKKTSITVKWKKLTKKQLKKSKATHYEIWVSTSPKFPAGANTKEKIVKKSKSSVKIKGLKKNTKYYVRVRAIRKSGSVKYVGKWRQKTIKTRKK